MFHGHFSVKLTGMKKGFSLSEVLIALVVLSVLIAIVTPVIKRSGPDPKKVMMKKAYAVAETIVNELINDTMIYPDLVNAPVATDRRWGFDDTNAVTVQGVSYSGTTKFPLLFVSKMNTPQTPVCTGSTNCTFTSSDGMTWNFTNFFTSAFQSGASGANVPGTANKPYILVDVNGAKPPNCYEGQTGCVDPDQFRIHIQSNGKMYVNASDTKAIDAITAHSKIHK